MVNISGNISKNVSFLSLIVWHAGAMGMYIEDSGKIIRNMAMESSLRIMEQVMSLKGHSRKTKKYLGSTALLMVTSSRASIRMTSSMAKVSPESKPSISVMLTS